MPKADVYAFRRPQPATRSKTFRVQGQEITITLRVPTSMDAFAIGDKIQELTAMYVPNERGEVAIQLPPLDGQPVEVTVGAIRFVAQVSVLQSADPEDRYTDVDLIMLLAADVGVEQMQELLMEVQLLTEVPAEDPLPLVGAESCGTASPEA